MQPEFVEAKGNMMKIGPHENEPAQQPLRSSIASQQAAPVTCAQSSTTSQAMGIYLHLDLLTATGANGAASTKATTNNSNNINSLPRQHIQQIMSILIVVFNPLYLH